MSYAGPWHDVAVSGGGSTPPELSVTGDVARAASSRGVVAWHLSLSHDGGVAVAFVIAESS